MDASSEVMDAMVALKEDGTLQKWGAALDEGLTRRNVMNGELRQIGIKRPDTLAVPSIRNDMAFLVTTVGASSIGAVLALAVLPGQWGFWGAYLIGGVSIAVVAIGSTAPGLLQFAIDKFSLVYPDYRERTVRHEAAHFLVAYLCGVPVTGYSVMIGKEHTDFAEAKIQQRLMSLSLEDTQIDQLAVTSMAGLAGEGMMFEEVMGQNGDLMDLQRVMSRAKTPMGDNAQQGLTRWAVWQACKLLKEHDAEYTALQEAMADGKSVADCIAAIESAKPVVEAKPAAAAEAPAPAAGTQADTQPATKASEDREVETEEAPKPTFDPSLFE